MKHPNIIDVIIAAVIATLTGGLVGRAIRAYAEATHEFDPRWGGLVGILVCLSILYMLEHNND